MIWTAYLVNPSSFSDSKYYREIYMTNNVEDSEPFYWENFENKLIQKKTLAVVMAFSDGHLRAILGSATESIRCWPFGRYTDWTGPPMSDLLRWLSIKA